MAALICLVFGLKCAATITQRNLFYLGVGFFALVLLLVGGRGPCIAAVISAATIPLINYQGRGRKSLLNRRRGSIVAMVAVSVVAAYFFWNHVNNRGELRTLHRLEALIAGEDLGGSAEARLNLWKASVRFWKESPYFGHGLGSFPVLYWNEDARSYPHNIFLELAVETGTVGVLLLLLLLFTAFRNLTSVGRLHDDPLRLLVAVLVVNAFLQVMISGDIPDNREFFGLLGLTCLVNRKVKSHAQKSRSSYVRTPAV